MKNENRLPYDIYFELGIKIPVSDFWYHANFFDVSSLLRELDRFAFYSLPIRVSVFCRDFGFIEQYDLKDFQDFLDKYHQNNGADKNA